MKIALQLYSIRDAINAENAVEVLKSLADMGYDGVELAGLYGMSAAELKAAADAAGLAVVSAHINWFELTGDTDGWVENLKVLGCAQAVIPHMTADNLPGGANWADVEAKIRALAATLNENGIRLAYHNHDFEFELVGGETKLDYLYRVFSLEELSCQIDTCWVNVAGTDPAAYVRKYEGRCPTVHFKDFHGVKNGCPYALIGVEDKKPDDTGTFEFRPCGSGVQDFAQILAASEAVGADWVIVEQDSPSMGKSSVECAQMSISYLKGLVK